MYLSDVQLFIVGWNVFIGRTIIYRRMESIYRTTIIYRRMECIYRTSSIFTASALDLIKFSITCVAAVRSDRLGAHSRLVFPAGLSLFKSPPPEGIRVGVIVTWAGAGGGEVGVREEVGTMVILGDIVGVSVMLDSGVMLAWDTDTPVGVRVTLGGVRVRLECRMRLELIKGMLCVTIGEKEQVGEEVWAVGVVGGVELSRQCSKVTWCLRSCRPNSRLRHTKQLTWKR